MTTAKKTAANRRNALRSTGPRTPAGKDRVSLNALRHGLRAEDAVLPYLERVQDWENHRAGLLAALAPVGNLEALLAERVALNSWRLQRVARFERENVALKLEPHEREPFDADVDVEKAKKELSVLREVLHVFEKVDAARREPIPLSGDEAADVLMYVVSSTGTEEKEQEDAVDLETFTLPGIPEGTAPEDFTGWTHLHLFQAVDAIAEADRCSTEDLWNATLRTVRWQVQRAQTGLRNEKRKLDRFRRARLLPGPETTDRVSRYEAHLERGLYKALHELQRLQAARGGEYVPPPAAVDVDLTLSNPGPEPVDALETAFEEA